MTFLVLERWRGRIRFLISVPMAQAVTVPMIVVISWTAG